MKKPGRGGKRSPGGRRRTDAQREAQLIQIGEMHIEGMSQYEIAEKLGLSQPQIIRDLKEISQRAAASPPADKSKLRDELARVSRHMRKKLFAAYNRSTEDKETQTKKQVVVQGAENDALNGGRKAKAPAERMEASLRSEEQCGNPAFMSEIGKCLEREAKLLGVYLADKENDKPGQVKFLRVIQQGTVETVTEENLERFTSTTHPEPQSVERDPMAPEAAALPAALPSPPPLDQKEAEPSADLIEISGENIDLHFHPGQLQAWNSQKRFVCIFSGTQGGKTTFGPPWLLREIARRGPGDYMCVTPTFPLLDMKALPTFQKLFEQTLKLGQFIGYRRKFIFSDYGKTWLFGADADLSQETAILFGHASDPESLESATAKAAWLDEAGQNRFRLGSWEAIQRRLSIHQGRALITTTPYNLGWLKQKLWDPSEAFHGNHPEIDIIRFDSTENPAFPKEEFERARRELPRWKFDLFYRAIFTRPAGLIYDCFNPLLHKCPRFEIPKTWQTYLGLDFGGIHTSAIFLAENPNEKTLYVYREYPGSDGTGSRFDGTTRTARQHVEALLAGEHKIPITVGGAKSEQVFRDEFRQAGLPVQEPNVMDSTAAARSSSSVEVGISRVYAAIANNQLKFFDDVYGILDEIEAYSRVTNEKGEVSEAIEDKTSWHGCDALRYIVGHIRKPMGQKFEMHSGGGLKWPPGVFPTMTGDMKCFDKKLEKRRLRRDFDDY